MFIAKEEQFLGDVVDLGKTNSGRNYLESRVHLTSKGSYYVDLDVLCTKNMKEME